MKSRFAFCGITSLLVFFIAFASGQERKVPDALEPWKDWATWDDRFRDCPTTYASGNDRICFWPSTLTLCDSPRGIVQRQVHRLRATWVPLPGGSDMWPLHVSRGGTPLPVIARDGRPSVELPTGTHELSGEFQWDELPEKIALPPSIGLLSLEVVGRPVAIPDWDEQGHIWLQRARAVETAEDILSCACFASSRMAFRCGSTRKWN